MSLSHRFILLNEELGLRPIKRDFGKAILARAAVEEAQAIESLHHTSYGGHRHVRNVSPLLDERILPLPEGWRKP